MKSDSWASFRAAAAPESLGEPDDDPVKAVHDASRHKCPVVSFAAVWYDDALCRDVTTGEVSLHRVEMGRDFSGETHADPYRAALRWARLMASRHEHAWLRSYVDGGHPHDEIITGPTDTTTDPEF